MIANFSELMKQKHFVIALCIRFIPLEYRSFEMGILLEKKSLLLHLRRYEESCNQTSLKYYVCRAIIRLPIQKNRILIGYLYIACWFSSQAILPGTVEPLAVVRCITIDIF